MMMIKRLSALCTWLLLTAAGLAAQQPPGQEGFVPASSLPPAEQLPAAPLLVAAYAFVWVAVFFYVWTIWRRLNKVEQEMHALERRSSRR
jgi:CcmD family protein